MILNYTLRYICVRRVSWAEPVIKFIFFINKIRTIEVPVKKYQIGRDDDEDDDNGDNKFTASASTLNFKYVNKEPRNAFIFVRII